VKREGRASADRLADHALERAGDPDRWAGPTQEFPLSKHRIVAFSMDPLRAWPLDSEHCDTER
jgi:hypothetical protein